MDKDLNGFYQRVEDERNKGLKIGIDLNNPDIKPILKPEIQKRNDKLGIVLFYGQFGWATGHSSGFGSACCVRLDDVDIQKMKGE